MQRSTLVLLPLLILSTQPAAAADTAQKTLQVELKSLEGTWELTTLLIAGKSPALPEGVVPYLIIKGNGFAFYVEDQAIGGTLAIDPAGKPKHFDTTTLVDQKNETQLGIYELKDDLLKVCSARAGKKRPDGFSSTPENGHELQTYKRVTWENDKQRLSYWVAFIQGPPATLRFIFNLERQDAKIVGGTLDIPDRRSKGLPLGTIRNEGRKLSIVSPSKTQSFEGEIAPDGRSIDGTWKSGKVSMPVTFARLAKVPDFFTRPQEPKAPLPYDVDEVAFENKAAGVKLAGTLTRPKVKEAVAAVVLISMSGAQDRDETEFGHKPFLVLADYLTRQGIAVLRYDDRGVGKSTGTFAGATSADFAEDARAAIDYLKTRKEIDPGKIGVLGHSEGGVVAPLVAAKSKDVAFVVLLAGPALPGDATALIQTALIFRAVGWSEKRIDFNVNLQKQFIAVLKEESNDAAAAAKIRQAIEQEFAKLNAADQKEVEQVKSSFAEQMIPETFPWHRFYLQHDPRPVLAKVSCPVLALFGEKDMQVTSKDHLPEMEKALRDNPRVTVKEIAQANHLLQKCNYGSMHEYCALTQTMAPEALQLVAEWIRRETAAK